MAVDRHSRILQPEISSNSFQPLLFVHECSIMDICVFCQSTGGSGWDRDMENVMLRFIYVILMNLFRAPYVIPKMRREADHPERYSEEERYELARHCIRLMKVTGGIHTKAYGQENLPKEGGYMMYPNHQGKYDAYGIVGVHEKPCSVVMDEAKSWLPFVKDVLNLLRGKRMNIRDFSFMRLRLMLFIV